MADIESVSGENNGTPLRCRFCGPLNQTRADVVGSAKCGRCRLPLSGEPHKKFADLDKHDYVHPADSRALAALRAIPGLDRAVKKLLQVTGEPQIRTILMASAVRVTPKQAPDLHAKLQVACTTLGVDMPELYIVQSPIANAFTYGVERHVVVLFTGLIERLSDDEILAVIAHEVGHIHAQHVLYLTVANLLELLAESAIKAAPVANLVVQILTTTMRAAL